MTQEERFDSYMEYLRTLTANDVVKYAHFFRRLDDSERNTFQAHPKYRGEMMALYNLFFGPHTVNTPLPKECYGAPPNE